MNIDLLIKMANEIGEFFSGASGEQAARDVANHLRRFWDPRMRAQMLKYYEERQGAGLSEVAKRAVALLKEASQAPGGTAPAAAPPVKPAAPAPGGKT
ncbi:MAG TPA: formate dehydrogenase subunit delta [Steroidobacteraceae bacterium]|nr:formate dehydrogenase subunit delta [Steroidobacteraceae bacterium]